MLFVGAHSSILFGAIGEISYISKSAMLPPTDSVLRSLFSLSHWVRRYSLSFRKEWILIGWAVMGTGAKESNFGNRVLAILGLCRRQNMIKFMNTEAFHGQFFIYNGGLVFNVLKAI